MHYRSMVWRAVLFFLFAAPFPATARTFKNSYLSFQMPPNWECKQEGLEWVCENTFSKKQREAIIVFTAKEVGPGDSLAGFQTFLNQARARTENNKPFKSKVLAVTPRMIANQPWVDGMHDGSEITGYFTRYMATIRDRTAILVTFSSHKEHFSKYSEDFRLAIESLRVTNEGPTGLQWASNPKTLNTSGFDYVGSPESPAINGQHATSLVGRVLLLAKHSKAVSAFLLLALFAGAYFWFGTKKKHKRRTNPVALIQKSRPIRQH